jgi:hypothetical protein
MPADSLETLRLDAIRRREEARNAAEKKRVQAIKLKLSQERQSRPTASQAATQLKNPNEKKFFERTVDELKYAPYPVPTVSQLLMEIRNYKEQIEFLKTVDLNEAAKCYDMKIFQYAKQLNTDAAQRRIKLMGGI